jgi:hypothetical protein
MASEVLEPAGYELTRALVDREFEVLDDEAAVYVLLKASITGSGANEGSPVSGGKATTKPSVVRFASLTRPVSTHAQAHGSWRMLRAGALYITLAG